MADSPDFNIAKKLCALDHGDLTRIVLVMDGHLERLKKTLKGLRVEALHEHYNRLVTTRNKVQAVWKASCSPSKRAGRSTRKARKSRG